MSAWTLELCTTADREEIRELMERSTNMDEPLQQVLNESQLQKQREEDRTLDILEEGHSIKAIASDGRIVGFTINKICPYRLEDFEPIKEVTDFFNMANEAVKLNFDGFLEVYVMGVDPDFRQLGLGRALGSATVELAKKNGFRGVKAYTSNQYATAMALSLGFRVGISIAYSDYKDANGKVIFKPPHPHTHLCIVVKDFGLNSKM